MNTFRQLIHGSVLLGCALGAWHAEPHGYGPQAMFAVERDVLTRVQDVEAAHPQRDREPC